MRADEIEPTIPHIAYSWESQARQFPKQGRPGLTFEVNDAGDGHLVECWIWRGSKGQVQGIAYHYLTDSGWEKPGNVNLYVDPRRRRRGIGLRLLAAVDAHVGGVEWDQQDFTPEGAALVRAFLRD